MDDLESKISAIMNDPSMMEKLMAMAQNLSAPKQAVQQTGANEGQPPDSNAEHPRHSDKSNREQHRNDSTEDALQQSGAMPDIAMLQKLSNLAGQSGIDKNQQSLLAALSPYLSNYRIEKLKKAMRAAQLAKLASGFLGAKLF